MVQKWVTNYYTFTNYVFDTNTNGWLGRSGSGNQHKQVSANEWEQAGMSTNEHMNKWEPAKPSRHNQAWMSKQEGTGTNKQTGRQLGGSMQSRGPAQMRATYE